MPAATELDQIDLSDAGLFANGPPFELFALMRAEAPVHRNNSPDPELRFWSITRFADISAVNRDFETFSSERGGVNIRADTLFPLEIARNVMINTDPPRHAKLRGIVSQVFSPRAVVEQEEHIRAQANRIIDGVIERGECELVADLALPLPLGVIADMLGVPAGDQPKLFDWTNRASNDDPNLRKSDEDALAAVAEIGQYLFGMLEARKENPTDDVLSRLMSAEVDGERLTDIELALNFFILMAAGNETTRNTFAGGVLALIEHPEERQKLLDDPGVIEGAIEEILRWVSAVQHQRRTATRDTELHGVKIAEGQKVVLWYPSGNRDEEAFEDPDRFDVSREPGNHQAFGGGGRHFCLGNQLARLELRVMFAEVLRRMPDIELAGPVRKTHTNLFNGVIEMPVRFTPGPREG